MPYANIKITDTDVTPEEKYKLIKGVTDLLKDVLDKDPEKTFVIIDEINLDNWGVAGEPVRKRVSQ